MIWKTGVGLLFIAVVLSLLTVLAACSRAPVTGRQQLSLVPAAQMAQMGDQAWEEMQTQLKPATDPATTAFVEKVARRIISVSELKDANWDIKVFESEDINAFALPGGHIGVFTGILPVAENSAGLATVLGHEVGHVVANHASERTSQQLLTAGALQGAAAAFGNPQHHNLLLGALGLGAQVGVLLPFSRKQESESDTIGLIFMAKAGYEPKESVAFWSRMQAKAGGGGPEFLATHPSSDRRMKDLTAMIPKAMEYYTKAPDQQGQGSRVPASH